MLRAEKKIYAFSKATLRILFPMRALAKAVAKIARIFLSYRTERARTTSSKNYYQWCSRVSLAKYQNGRPHKYEYVTIKTRHFLSFFFRTSATTSTTDTITRCSKITISRFELSNISKKKKNSTATGSYTIIDECTSTYLLWFRRPPNPIRIWIHIREKRSPRSDRDK